MCSGYQDVDGLRILNQTKAVTSSMGKDAVPASPALPIQFPGQDYVLTSTASCVFFTEYYNPAAGFVEFDFDFITPIYRHAKADEILTTIVAALGMIFLARRSKNKSLIVEAAHKYSLVLKMGAEALCDIATAKSDEMLATVWLLSLYEVRNA